MVFLRFENFLASQYDIIRLVESGAMSLDDSVNVIASFEQSYYIESLQFFIIMSAQWCHHFSLSGHLSPPTRVSPITGLQYLLKYHMLVLLVKLTFRFDLRHQTIRDLKPDLQDQK